MKLRANLVIGGALFATVVVAGALAPFLAHTDPVMDANLMNAEVAPGSEFWFGTDAQGRDIPVVQGCILTIVLFFLVVNIAVDVLCAVVDPRIKYS